MCLGKLHIESIGQCSPAFFDKKFKINSVVRGITWSKCADEVVFRCRRVEFSMSDSNYFQLIECPALGEANWAER